MQNRSQRRNKRQVKIVLLIIGIFGILSMCGFLLQRAEKMFVRQKDAVRKEEPAEEPKVMADTERIVELDGNVYTYNHRIETWLFIGTDASGQEDAQGKDYRGSMADFLLLAILDKTDKTYAFLQINRDTIAEVTMLQTDGSGAASANLQICTAHWYGGSPQQSCENTVEAVSKLLGGVDIDGYYSLSMEDIPELNHAVGGVEVKIMGDFSKSEPSLREGEIVLLNDKQAYTYVCGRYHVGDETNVQRMERQKQYMEALFNKVHDTFRQNPKFLNLLYEQLEDKAVTDTKGRDVSRIISRMADGESRGIFKFEGKTRIGQRLGDGLDHVEFHLDQESLIETMKKLYHLEKTENTKDVKTAKESGE